MKKFLMTLIAAMLSVSVTLLGIGCGENPTTSSSSESSEEKVVVTVKERTPVFDAVTANYSTLTLGDICEIANNETVVVEKLMKGIMLGDVVKTILDSSPDNTLKFDYYSDDYWYIDTANDADKKKFQYPANVIFKYELGGGKPLGFTKADLEKYGSNKVVATIENQFSLDISGMVAMLPEGVSTLINKFFEMTITDLYNISNKDYSFVTNFVNGITTDEYIDCIFGIAKMDTSLTEQDIANITEVQGLLKDIFDGPLNNPTIANEVKVEYVLNKIKTLVAETDAVSHSIIDSLLELYKGTFLKDIFANTMTLQNEVVLNHIEKIVKVAITDPNKQEGITKWFDDARSTFTGTVADIDFTTIDSAKLVTLLNEILKEATNTADQTALATEIVKYTQETLKLANALVNNQDIKDASAKIAEYIKNLVKDVDTVFTEEAEKFIADVSDYLAELYVKGKADLTKFEEAYKNLTFVEVDTYLNGALTKLMDAMGVTVDQNLKDKKLVDFIKFPEFNVVDFVYNNLLLPSLEKDVTMEDGAVKKIKDLTIRQFDTMYLNGFIAQQLVGQDDILKYLDIMTMGVAVPMVTQVVKDAIEKGPEYIYNTPLKEIDKAILQNQLTEVAKKMGALKLLDYTISDFETLSTATPNENLVNDIKAIKVCDIVNFVIELTNTQNATPVAA